MRYFAILALAGLLCMIGFALVLDQRDLFGVLAAFGLVIFGLPLLGITADYWLGPQPPEIVLDDATMEDEPVTLASMGIRDWTMPKDLRDTDLLGPLSSPKP